MSVEANPEQRGRGPAATRPGSIEYFIYGPSLSDLGLLIGLATFARQIAEGMATAIGDLA
jgi:hypothetical protein